MKSRSASKIKLTSYDDLIGGAVSKDDIQEIPIGQLRDFVNHPFHVNDDDETIQKKVVILEHESNLRTNRKDNLQCHFFIVAFVPVVGCGVNAISALGFCTL